MLADLGIYQTLIPDLKRVVPDQVRTLSQVGTSSYMAYAM